MTISTTSRRAGPFTGNGSTTAFAFAFKVFADTDLVVYQYDLLDAEEVLVLDSDYSVTLNSDQDEDPGGTVTLSAALVADYTLVIVSAVPQTQLLNLTNMGSFFPANINTAFDRVIALIQQLQDEVDRCIKLPVTAEAGEFTLPLPEANQLLAWNADADGVVNYDPEELIQVVAAGDAATITFAGTGAQTSFTLASSPGALANLRVSIDGVVQVPTADYTWTSGTTLTFTTAPPDGSVIFVQYQSAA